MHLLDILHSKLELFRLEQRYTKRRNCRSTFVSEAQYIDGEYVYSPTSTYSKTSKNNTGNTSASNTSASDNEEEARRGAMFVKEEAVREEGGRRKVAWGMGEGLGGKDGEKERVGEKVGKIGRRLSKMGLGDWTGKGKGVEAGRKESRVSVREIKWDARS